MDANKAADTLVKLLLTLDPKAKAWDADREESDAIIALRMGALALRSIDAATNGTRDAARAWTQQEDEMLVYFQKQDVPIEQISKLLCRRDRGIAKQLSQLKHHIPRRNAKE